MITELKHSRRLFKVAADMPFSLSYLGGKKGEFNFPRAKDDFGCGFYDREGFNNVKECEEYLNTVDLHFKEFTPMEKVEKQLYGVKFKQAPEMDDSHWDMIRSLMRNPGRFEKKDIRNYTMTLATNWVDRDLERFVKDFLITLGDTIIEKSVLIGHDKWSGGGVGLFYDSSIVQIDLAQAKSLIGKTTYFDIEPMLRDIQKRDNGLYVLEADFFIPVTKSTEDMLVMIDAGVWKWVSISFRAPLRKTIMKEEGSEDVLFWEFHNTADVKGESVEGSFVYLGSQLGASIKKDFGQPIDERYSEYQLNGKTMLLPKEVIEKLNQGDLKMLEEKKVEEQDTDQEQKVDENVDQQIPESEIPAKSEDTTEPEETEQTPEIKEALEISAQVKTEAVETIMRYGLSIGVIPKGEEPEKAYKELLEGMPYKQLKGIAEQHRKVFEANNKGKLPQNIESKTVEPEPKQLEIKPNTEIDPSFANQQLI